MAFNAHILHNRYFLGLAVSIPTLLAVKHIWEIYRIVRHVPKRRVVELDGVSELFRSSQTLERLVNPRHHIFVGDTRHVVLPLTENVEDTTILAAFVSGFFGGKVFAPERVVLQIVGKRLTAFSGLGPDNDNDGISSAADVPSGQLPALRTMLFGAFQVSHVHIDEREDLGETTSSIDFIYGSDQGRFAGAHRFSVVRNRSEPEEVRVVFESVSCNPTKSQLFAPAFLFSFHRFYAMLLFRESTTRVLDVLNHGTYTAVICEAGENVRDVM